MDTQVIVRRNGRKFRRISLYLPIELDVPLRVFAARHRRDLTSTIVDLISRVLYQHQLAEQEAEQSPR